ncbi:MAG TPA: methylenetetrahydrofolate reductase [Clostridia bacterium]|nr:methylenetetrahydrofolate reductase [Clostridia bacterium]
MDNRFRSSLLDKNIMSVTWELVPGRGATETSQENAFLAAEQAAKGGVIHALTITDNAGGNPAISASYLGMEILKLGIEPLVHFTCKDKNRNQMESELYALERAKVKNLLIMTGDYPVTGFKGTAKPVFDLDPLQTLELINHMNSGLELPTNKGTVKLKPTNFFAGAAVSPFKATEAEQMIQYYKLLKKIESGAQFIVTQVGYDARKYHELLQFMRMHNLNVPVIGNIYVLSYGTAKTLNQNKIPGAVVTDKLLQEIEQERNGADKGLEAKLLRAAKMYAIMKGLGFAGVHIGGYNLKYEQVEYIVKKGEELFVNWEDIVQEFDYPQKEGFYYFKKDEKSGLNTTEPVNRQNLPLNAPVHFVYKLSRFVHYLFFIQNKNLYFIMQKICKLVSNTKLEKIFHYLEHIAKVILYDCKDCGDCALPDLAYICPMSQCPKHQRNGACEGSYYGWCEVHPYKKKCVWVKAYARLKYYKEEKDLSLFRIPPCNWDFYQTSSWINFYLGKDHSKDIQKVNIAIENNKNS